jgi:hypothetical protein
MFKCCTFIWDILCKKGLECSSAVHLFWIFCVKKDWNVQALYIYFGSSVYIQERNVCVEKGCYSILNILCVTTSECLPEKMLYLTWMSSV